MSRGPIALDTSHPIKSEGAPSSCQEVAGSDAGFQKLGRDEPNMINWPFQKNWVPVKGAPLPLQDTNGLAKSHCQR